jgi:hypothetical protein
LICVGGMNSAGAARGAQEVSAKNNRTVIRLGSKRGGVTCVKLKRLSDIQRRERF